LKRSDGHFPRKARDLSSRRAFRVLNTLAAAYAEAGQFTEAARWQTKAMALAPEPAQQSVRALLELYQKGKPFRQLPG
jgi:hypothetical protein